MIAGCPKLELVRYEKVEQAKLAVKKFLDT